MSMNRLSSLTQLDKVCISLRVENMCSARSVATPKSRHGLTAGQEVQDVEPLVELEPAPHGIHPSRNPHLVPASQ